MNGHFDTVRLLIDANADIDLPDKVVFEVWRLLVRINAIYDTCYVNHR